MHEKNEIDEIKLVLYTIQSILSSIYICIFIIIFIGETTHNYEECLYWLISELSQEDIIIKKLSLDIIYRIITSNDDDEYDYDSECECKDDLITALETQLNDINSIDFETVVLICKLLFLFHNDIDYDDISINTIMILKKYVTTTNDVNYILIIWKFLSSIIFYPKIFDELINYNIYDEIIPILLLIYNNLSNNIDVYTNNELLKYSIEFIKEMNEKSI